MPSNREYSSDDKSYDEARLARFTEAAKKMGMGPEIQKKPSPQGTIEEQRLARLTEEAENANQERKKREAKEADDERIKQLRKELAEH